MFAKPILLKSLTSCVFVFSEQTQNFNKTTKSLYIEAIFVFLVQYIKETLKRFLTNTIQFKQDYFHFLYVTGFLRINVLTSIPGWDSFPTAMPRSLPATRRPLWRSSVHPRKALQPLLGPRIHRKVPSVLSILRSSPQYFLYWILKMTTTNLTTISLL